MATALVVGNMIGSGVFLLPASLAEYRGYSLLSWIVTATGTLLLAITFARLARRIPKTGGPYVYAREGFGEFAGFFMAWGYWISVVAANAAIASAMTSYLAVFWPALATSQPLALAVTLGAVWVLTALNARGIRNGGVVQVVTTVLKIVPLVVIGAVGLFHLQADAFALTPPAGQTPVGALNAAIALTLFAFLGFESAGIPADNVVEPERTIPRATILGTAITAVVYVASTVAVMGLVPSEALVASTAPFSDAARALWGGWAAYVMGIGAIVSCFGALNGWTLVQGQIPLAMARDGLFPRLFARTRPDGTPAVAIVVSSVFVSMLLIFSFTGTLVELFTKTILLSTLAAVVPYVFAALAEVRFALSPAGRAAGASAPPAGAVVVPVLAFLYAMWAVVGAGEETVYLGFLLLLAGLPIYVWLKAREAS